MLAPLLLAGCVGGDGLGLAGGSDATREPYYKEHREVVSGEHARAFEVPVDAAGSLVNVSIVLAARTNGLPLPDASFARLDVTLLDPAGEAVERAVLDARTPSASLVADGLAPGDYLVEVKGVGAAPEADGRTYGASYVLTIEVAYPG